MNARLNDYELTVLVEAAASGTVNSRASIHGGSTWDEMDPATKNNYREAALPFILHGTRELSTLGYSKPRTITTAEELDALPVGSVILDGSGLSLHKNEFTGWVASNGAKNIGAEMLLREALPATVLYEPEPLS
jgi:hypothetical protein